jgi:excisionase family DNA binding protein
MTEERLITVREVASLLNITEKEVIELAEMADIPAYKIGGVYLRFKRSQIEEFKKTFQPWIHKNSSRKKDSVQDKINDFLYFNDFYILAGIIIILLLVIIFQG